MALTLIKSPIGHKLSDSEIDAQIIDDGQGNALVYTGFAHSLSDGDYVYIQSNFESYNGFKYVDSIAYDSFKIKESANEDYIEFIQSATITYRVSVLNHGWQCVHLPIVYEIESSIYPNNSGEESYTANTVISQSNENGYTRLALSAALTDPTELSKIEFIGSGALAGVYQIITVYEAWNVVIDLAYSASNSFTGLQAVKYYDNYAVNVRVWAGLNSNHRWADVKPYQIAATLQLIPDENNRVKFSISELLRSYIKTRNNLTLDTLPNNLDFMVSFYIQYFETYDESDGTTISTYTGAPTTDDFVGYAVNAKLPFKSESISHLSDYVNEDVFYAKWLTLQSRPIAVVGRFFDLSFINQFLGCDINVYVEKSVNDITTETEVIEIENPGYGVIRVPLTIESGFDQYCVYATTPGTPDTPGVTSAISLPALSTGVNVAGSGTDWTTGSNPIVTLSGSAGTHVSDVLRWLYDFVNGYDYEIVFNIGHTATISTLDFYVYDDSDNILFHDSSTAVGSGTDNFTFTFTASTGMTKYGIKVTRVVAIPTSSMDVDVNTQSGEQTTPAVAGIASQQITERICIDVIEECDSTFIQSSDDIRLTEDGNYRILE